METYVETACGNCKKEWRELHVTKKLKSCVNGKHETNLWWNNEWQETVDEKYANKRMIAQKWWENDFCSLRDHWKIYECVDGMAMTSTWQWHHTNAMNKILALDIGTQIYNMAFLWRCHCMHIITDVTMICNGCCCLCICWIKKAYSNMSCLKYDIIYMVRVIYDGSKTHKTVHEMLREWFSTVQEIKQKCVLFPSLLIFLSKYIMNIYDDISAFIYRDLNIFLNVNDAVLFIRIQMICSIF